MAIYLHSVSQSGTTTMKRALSTLSYVNTVLERRSLYGRTLTLQRKDGGGWRGWILASDLPDIQGDSRTDVLVRLEERVVALRREEIRRTSDLTDQPGQWTGRFKVTDDEGTVVHRGVAPVFLFAQDVEDWVEDQFNGFNRRGYAETIYDKDSGKHVL